LSHELRWNPLLGGWIIVSGGREERPWREEYCPFCPGGPETQGDWNVLSIPNRFPALSPDAPQVFETSIYPKSRALGRCEVIVETRKHEGDFHNMPLSQVSDFIRLLADRTKELASLRYVKHIMPFKNKGALIGVSLTHPHSQLYALPFVPPRISREIASVRRFTAKHHRNLFDAILESEIEDRSRLIYSNERFTVVLPFFGMWPFETHIYTSTPLRSLVDLDERSQLMLADAIRATTATYEGQFGKDCAYIMVFHQAPSKGHFKNYRLHLEFYTPHITRDRIKYAAGIEMGAGTFTYDGIPEERASVLREAAGRALSKIECLGKVTKE
jgi:UDPglucose--hexose-1-phosphate uridylyltransferase